MSEIHIGKVVRNATLFNPRHWQGGPLNVEPLFEAVSRLFTLLEEREVDYLLVGGVALLQYIEGRNTEDIDLIMAVSALQQMPEIQIASQDVYFAQGQFDDLRIDFLLTRNPLFDIVRQHYATAHHFVERHIPCATVEGLLLLKLYALPSLYRQGNFARVGLYENDIATLIQVYSPQLDPLLNELAAHFSETDLAAVRDILAELQQRIERFSKGLDAGPEDSA